MCYRFVNPERALVMDAKGFFDRKAMKDANITLWRL